MSGIGILLVVLSHAIIKNDPTIVLSYGNSIFNSISAFFMPMFMMISGYVVYNKVGNWNWTKRHILKWVLPVIIFALLYWAYNALFPTMIHFYGLSELPFETYAIRMIAYGFGGSILWFIWAFMVCYAITYVLEQSRLKFSQVPLWVQTLLLIVILNAIPFALFGFLAVKWYGIFFFIGYTLNHYRLNKKVAYLSIVAFPLSLILTDWTKSIQNTEWGNFGQTTIIPAIANGHLVLVLLIFLVAILGIGFVYSIASLIKWKPLVSILTYLGENSIGIYLLHVMFVGITNNYWLSTILAAIISIGLYEVLKRIRFMNFILFGGEPIKFQITRRLV